MTRYGRIATKPSKRKPGKTRSLELGLTITLTGAAGRPSMAVIRGAAPVTRFGPIVCCRGAASQRCQRSAAQLVLYAYGWAWNFKQTSERLSSKNIVSPNGCVSSAAEAHIDRFFTSAVTVGKQLQGRNGVVARYRMCSRPATGTTRLALALQGSLRRPALHARS